MKLINERLEFLVETFARGRYSDFCEQTGLQYGTFKNYISGRLSKPSSDSLERIILTFPEINAKWLLTGHGEPFDEPEKKKEPVGNGDDGLTDELFKLRKQVAEFEQMKEQLNIIIAMQSAAGIEKASLRGRLKKSSGAPVKGRGFGVEQGKFLF